MGWPAPVDCRHFAPAHSDTVTSPTHDHPYLLPVITLNTSGIVSLPGQGSCVLLCRLAFPHLSDLWSSSSLKPELTYRILLHLLC